MLMQVLCKGVFLNDPHQSIAKARYDLFLIELGKQSGRGSFSQGSIDAMRETLACAVYGFEYAFPFAGWRNRVWWLCWKPDHSEVADFFGKTGFSDQKNMVRVTAEYADAVKGHQLLEMLRKCHSEDELREICRGYVLTHQRPEQEAETLFRLLTVI